MKKKCQNKDVKPIHKMSHIWPEVLSRYVYLLICIPFAINWRFISHIPHGRPSSFHYFITSLCWKHKNKTQMKLLYKSKILIRQCVDHVISTGRWMLKLVLKIFSCSKLDLFERAPQCKTRLHKKPFGIRQLVEMTWSRH